jgi:type IV pilus assembly protein PilW
MSADYLTQIANGKDGSKCAWLKQSLNDFPGKVYECNSPSRSQRGLTLVELMIAMILGLFLIGGLLQIFISSKQTYRMQEALSRLQENGRFAIDFMTRDIRLAGFKGCSSRSYAAMPPVLNQATAFLYDFNTAIQGFEANPANNTWTPSMVAAISDSEPLGGSDVIAIRRADEQGFAVTAQGANTLTLDDTVSGTNPNLTASNANLTASLDNFINAGFLNSSRVNNCAIVVVSDCADAAVVFQISAVNVNVLGYSKGNCMSGSKTILPGNDFINLPVTGVGSQVFPINTISYYVKTADNQPSLYRGIGDNAAQALVEGVENMEILYGVDTDADVNSPNYGTANYYVKADSNALYVPGDAVASAFASVF